jgi:hypothetical protein
VACIGASRPGETEDPFQDREFFAVDLPVRHACNRTALFRHMRAGPVLPPDVVRLPHHLSLGLALRDVAPDVRRRDRGHPPTPEEWVQVFRYAALDFIERPFAVRAVIVHHVGRGVLKPESADFGGHGSALRDVALADPEQIDRGLLPRAVR